MDSDVSDFKKESNCKTIYLVRHAESENNVSKRAFKESLGKLRPPSWTQIATMAPMVTFPMNTALSERGVRQVPRILYSAWYLQLNFSICVS